MLASLIKIIIIYKTNLLAQSRQAILHPICQNIVAVSVECPMLTIIWVEDKNILRLPPGSQSVAVSHHARHGRDEVTDTVA